MIESEVVITPSTRKRTPLDPKYVKPIDEYFSDGLSTPAFATAADQYRLTNVLKDFYLVTGVQPYLWVEDNLGDNTSPGYSEVESAMYEKYADLFEDEGHLLVLYYVYPDGTYNSWYMWGNDAHEYVMDDEACEILLDYIDMYYTICYENDGADYTEMFCRAFSDAGSRIMGVISDSTGEQAQNGSQTAKPDKRCALSTGGLLIVLVIVLFVAGITIFFIVRGSRKDNSDYEGMSEDDIRKEKYRRKYGGKK